MKSCALDALCLLPIAACVMPAYAADYLTVADAQRLLFPGAQVFLSEPVVLSEAQQKQIRKQAGVRQRQATQPVWRVEKDGQLVGWFIVDEVIGKHEFITYAAALSVDGHVLGIEIMNYRETHGDEVRQPEWRQHFVGKSLDDRFKLDVDVPNISGATLSCRNVLDGVKRLLVLQKLALPTSVTRETM